MSAEQSLTAVAGGVTEVKTDIFVTSFGPVSDVEMVRFHFCRGGVHVTTVTAGALRWPLSACLMSDLP